MWLMAKYNFGMERVGQKLMLKYLMIRLLLIDDREIVLAGWRMRLALEPDMKVVGEAGHLESALSLSAAVHPDVVLLDVRMGGTCAGRGRRGLCQQRAAI